jgi:nitroreductase
MTGPGRRATSATNRGHQPGAGAGGAAGDLATASADGLEALLAIAGRAPSIHNTQPWRFRVTGDAVELFADPGRQLAGTDPHGREMLISCGAALFGLRLAVRRAGFRPIVQSLPDRLRPELLARVELGEPVPLNGGEQSLIAAVRRRHTHRGPFTGQPLPAGLPAALRRDAGAEGASLVVVRGRHRFDRLARLVADADRRQRGQSAVAAEAAAWTRPAASAGRDGIPARAYPARPTRQPQALTQRDFDLGRGWGTVTPAGDGAGISAGLSTAVLTTPGDRPEDWLRAGQALYRLLLRAAAGWVFASMHTQPLEIAPIRAALRTRLQLPGVPQMLLQFGHAGIAPLTPRRPVHELLI